MSVKEWPEPTAFTVWPAAAAAFTDATSSASSAGWSTASAAHCWLPPQFLQVASAIDRMLSRPVGDERSGEALGQRGRERMPMNALSGAETSASRLQRFDELGDDLVDV